MHRFYLPPEHCSGITLRLNGREAHHALHVLRVKRGDLVTVLDGAGYEYFCEIADCSHNSLTLRVTKKNFAAPLPCSITLIVAIPKGKIIESIIQKSVELGAQQIVPLLTERVVTQPSAKDKTSKREKWQQVAIEAAKQCGAAWLPKIEIPMTIGEFLAGQSASPEANVPHSKFRIPNSAFDLSLVGSLQMERRHPCECVQEFQSKYGRLPQSVAVWIGPEGDFTPDELGTIQSSGAQPISLGPLVLRVETAAIYCLSILNYELNR